jgi:predicted nicotinamide N-methyase
MSIGTANKRRAYGIEVLLSNHRDIRRLKREHFPSSHGNKFWTSSWLLMDYFKKRGMPPGTRVMEIGCGWGLAGIYCAKKHDARVTGVDVDPDVFPFLDLHAEMNNVRVNKLRRKFGGLTADDLKKVDVIIGADICFWDSLVLPLKRLILKAMREKVKMVVIADPGRSPFDELAGYLQEKMEGKVFDWEVQRPRNISGKILKVGSLKK